ncbi:MAG: site-2 protease family protein [Firmicutes bacterium]|nr:site-2 protease family protein [Bacillota bacterium]
MMTGLLAIPMLGLVILIHELGHAAGAVSCNMRVDELIIGFGPKIGQWTFRDLLVTLRVIPVGGALSIDDGEYERASVARKRICLLAGPATSMLGGWMLCVAGKFAATVGKGSLCSRVTDSVAYATRLTGLLVPGTAEALIGAATGTPAEFVGPLGLAGWMNSLDVVSLPVWLVLAGIISVGAGLFNLLPLPPLDGGRALVARVEERLGVCRLELLERMGIVLVAALGIVVAIGDLFEIVF